MANTLLLSDIFSIDYYFFGWRDAVEILTFSTLFYWVSRWLKRDKQKNLVGYFYSYCALCFTAYFAQLPTMTTFLFMFAPVMIIFFLLMHQETLQKNFVALRNITPAKLANSQWLDTLVRTCLVAINNNKEVMCVIEQHDNLTDFIDTSLTMHTDLNKDLLNMMLASETFDATKMIWLNTNGHVLGVNSTWKNQPRDEALSDDVKKLEPWKQDALFFTNKTDALVFKVDPKSRTFDIVVSGKTYDNISSNHTLKMIKKHVITHEGKGATHHDSQSKKDTAKQRGA